MCWQAMAHFLYAQNTDPDLEDDVDDGVEEEDEVTEKRRKLVSFPIRDGMVGLACLFYVGNAGQASFTEPELPHD